MKVEIRKPCHLEWNSLSETKCSDYKFCKGCKENIYDFSNSSNSEIAQFVTKLGKQKVCGILPSKPSFRITRRNHSHKGIFMICLIFLSSIVLFSCKNKKKTTRKNPGFISVSE